jgi:hypothetical protein
MSYGSGETLAALARGEDVDPAKYVFCTLMRFEAGRRRLARCILPTCDLNSPQHSV